jgi:3-hydroxybutyryl-CoA dehydrogenase
MGAQISQVLALAGFEVLAYDLTDELLEKGLRLIKEGKYGLKLSIDKGRVSPDAADQALSRISTTRSLERALDHAQFVLEAAVEDLKTKRGIFKKASSLAEPRAVLATNTSTLSVSRISERLQLKDRRKVAGMHFFNPPQVMKVVEVVKTPWTNEKTLSTVQAVTDALGKTAVLVLDYPGFVANRIGLSVFAEASQLLERKIANVRDIDLSMRLGYGYPLGPFELGDLVGLDSRLRNMKALYVQTKDRRFFPPRILRKLVSEGYLGDPKTKPGSKGGYYEFYGLKRPQQE